PGRAGRALDDLRLRGRRRAAGVHPAAGGPVAARAVPVRPPGADVPAGRDRHGRGRRPRRPHGEAGPPDAVGAGRAPAGVRFGPEVEHVPDRWIGGDRQMTWFVTRFDFRAPGADPAARRELYARAVEQAAYADAHGQDVLSLPEHHGADDGYLPSPLVVAAAMAAVTRRVSIGVM